LPTIRPNLDVAICIHENPQLTRPAALSILENSIVRFAKKIKIQKFLEGEPFRMRRWDHLKMKGGG